MSRRDIEVKLTVTCHEKLEYFPEGQGESTAYLNEIRTPQESHNISNTMPQSVKSP